MWIKSVNNIYLLKMIVDECLIYEILVFFKQSYSVYIHIIHSAVMDLLDYYLDDYHIPINEE